jgi:hypothetical protein
LSYTPAEPPSRRRVIQKNQNGIIICLDFFKISFTKKSDLLRFLTNQKQYNFFITTKEFYMSKNWITLLPMITIIFLLSIYDTSTADDYLWRLCTGINNSMECAEKIENYQLKKGVSGVSRTGKKLIIALKVEKKKFLLIVSQMIQMVNGIDIGNIFHQ